MDNLYNEMVNIKDRNLINRLDNQSINEINGSIETKEFINAEKQIITEVSSGNIDVRLVYMYFKQNFIINEFDKYAGLIKEYIKIIKEFDDTFKQQKNFKLDLEKASISLIDSFIKKTEYKIEEKTIDKFDVKTLDNALKELHDTVFDLTEYDMNSYRVIELLKPFEIKKEEKIKTDKTIETEKVDELKKSYDDTLYISEGNKAERNIYGNHLWEKLKKKISIFQKVVSAKRILDAAILYEDINNEIHNFDPRKYFPEVFLPIYKVMNSEVADILKMLQNKNSIEWFMASNFNLLGAEYLPSRETVEYPNCSSELLYMNSAENINSNNIKNEQPNIQKNNVGFNDI
ncbi:MAG TPA: type VI secretion system protein IglI family protein [Victivallales bacterium]|nr:type VI secretion system protein IglI family protein [Victivallales bacterium]